MKLPHPGRMWVDTALGSFRYVVEDMCIPCRGGLQLRVTRYYAETYTSEASVDNAFPAWLAKRSIGAPIVNVGHASLSATYAATYRACRAIPRSTYLGIYSSTPVTAANGKLGQVQKALVACTR